MPIGEDLMAQPPDVLLPQHDAARAMREQGAPARDIAAAHPADSAAWADLAAEALTAGDAVTAYAFARTGYHRGLDALRRAGWKGWGSVPWSHEPNRGVLRCFAYLAEAARLIGEDDEVQRLHTLLDDSDPTAREQISAAG